MAKVEQVVLFDVSAFICSADSRTLSSKCTYELRQPFWYKKFSRTQQQCRIIRHLMKMRKAARNVSNWQAWKWLPWNYNRPNRVCAHHRAIWGVWSGVVKRAFEPNGAVAIVRSSCVESRTKTRALVQSKANAGAAAADGSAGLLCISHLARRRSTERMLDRLWSRTITFSPRNTLATVQTLHCVLLLAAPLDSNLHHLRA